VKEFIKELELRAKSSLENEAEVTQKALEVATAETLQECKGKDVKAWAKMDFAMIRLKIYLKISLSDEDVLLLKNAKKEISTSAKLGETKNKDDGFYYTVV